MAYKKPQQDLIDWTEEDYVGEENNSAASKDSRHSNQPVVCASHDGLKEIKSYVLYKSYQ